MATKVQTEYFNMFQIVDDQMSKDLVSLLAIPGFKEKYNRFSENLLQLFQLNIECNTRGSGVSGKLKEVRKNLIEAIYSVSSKENAYALMVEDLTLMNEINFTKTDLVKSTYQNLVSEGEMVLKRADSLFTELVPYHVTREMLDDLRLLLSQFRKIIPSVRKNINKRKASGQHMASLIKTNLKLLYDVDKLVEVIRSSDPLVYLAYKKSRKIVSLPTYRKAVIGKIVCAATNSPLKGVIVHFYVDGDQQKVRTTIRKRITQKPVLIKTTALLGGFNVNNLPEGMYRVAIMKTGYKAESLNLAVTANETARIEVRMEKVI